ncbi:MAG TPA: 4-vinyl reductase [Thermoplasmata archaeon]
MPQSDQDAPTIDPKRDLSAIGTTLARKLLAVALTPDPETGILLLSGQSCLIVRPDVIMNIQKQLEQTMGSSSKGIMYLSGERSAGAGLNPLASIESESKGAFNFDRARRIIEASAFLGWGRAAIRLFDPDAGRFVISIKNSPLARSYGPSKKPVCHFLAGWLAGLGRILLSKELLCEETVCASQGPDHCEFDLRPMPLR